MTGSPTPVAVRTTPPAVALPLHPDPTSLSLVVTGHVDHGKSSVVGRLLADTGSIPASKVDAVRAHCERHAKPFEHAFLLDALREERAQGITIEAARVFFKSSTRAYQVIDTPGHSEFLRNMVTGASRADAALLVIDAREGVQDNSRRHAHLLAMLGIGQVAVVINKMDLVQWSAASYQGIVGEYSAFLSSLRVSAHAFIPASASTGDNIVERSPRMRWYLGPTVLSALDQFAPSLPLIDAAFRFPVQGVYKFTSAGDDRRIVAGTVASGTIRVGDRVIFLPSGKRSRVKSIEGFNTPVRVVADAGEATGFTLEDHIYVSRGQVAVREGERAPVVSRRIEVSLFWLGRTPLARGRDYLLKHGSARVRVRLAAIRQAIDASTLVSRPAADHVARHEIATCTLDTARPIAWDTVDHLGPTSRFVIVDGFQIAGGGVVTRVLGEHSDQVDAASSEGLGPRACVIWLTGLSGSGKSTIGQALRDELESLGTPVEYLDGDALREMFPGTGFTRPERDAHVQRVAFLASRLERHGVTVVCALISPYRDARARARALCGRFVEVHVATPLEICEQRDVKGLYARARRGEIAGFTGIDDPYEPPPSPEVTVDTRDTLVDEAVARVLDAVDRVD